MYIKDQFGSMYQLLINRKEKVRIEKLKNQFIVYSQIIDIYENIKDYNPTKKSINSAQWQDMTSDMEANKKLGPIGTELFL